MNPGETEQRNALPLDGAVDLDAAPRPAAPQSAIEVEGLVKRYKSMGSAESAVRDVSLTVFPGEALALLGPNGAGKSTTINILATLLSPDSGSVRIAGYDVAASAIDARRVLGVALQETGLPRNQTAKRLLWYHARLHGSSSSNARKRVDDVVDRFELDGLDDRPISSYSSGERRRLDIALALVHSPRVVLLDEPTAGLDLASRQLIWRQLRLQLASGAALLFSTHDLQEADTQADRIAVMREGRLIARSTPHELRQCFGSRTIRIVFRSESEASRGARILTEASPADAFGLTIDIEDDAQIQAVLQRLARHGVVADEFTVGPQPLEAVFDRITTEVPGDQQGSGRV